MAYFGRQSEFFIGPWMDEERLYISRKEGVKSVPLSQSRMTPDDVDYEMQRSKNREMLQICDMTQQSLEYFVQHYGKTYRYLEFYRCLHISDFSPLEDLEMLEEVDIHWSKADRLWDFSKNPNLDTFVLVDAKKLAYCPDMLKTSSTLERIRICGGMWENYPFKSMECFAGMPGLRELIMQYLKLEDHNMGVLDTLPSLKRFDFDAGMLTTEEIARIVAKHPELTGVSLCAYSKEEAVTNDVRVCGYRKPGLDLPRQQARLDKYVAEFNALVEKYRNEG